MNEIQTASTTSWHELNKHLNSFSEQELKELLVHETANKRRLDFIKRIHQRYTIVRAKRERSELTMLGAMMES